MSFFYDQYASNVLWYEAKVDHLKVDGCSGTVAITLLSDFRTKYGVIESSDLATSKVAPPEA